MFSWVLFLLQLNMMTCTSGKQKTAGGRMAAMISRFAGKTQRRTKTDVFVLLFLPFFGDKCLVCVGEAKKIGAAFRSVAYLHWQHVAKQRHS